MHVGELMKIVLCRGCICVFIDSDILHMEEQSLLIIYLKMNRLEDFLWEKVFDNLSRLSWLRGALLCRKGMIQKSKWVSRKQTASESAVEKHQKEPGDISESPAWDAVIEKKGRAN